MQHVPGPINQYNPYQEPRPESRPVPYTTPLRMPESPFKPTSSLRHRRQSSTITSTGLSMSPSSYSSDAEFRGNNDVEAASRYLGEAMGGGGEVGRRVLERSGTDEELGRIAQAMTLLSLHPTGASAGVQFHPPTAFGSAPSPSTGPTSWPSPEELLKESLRQSLSALHALGRIKSLVDNLPDSGEKDEKEGERGIAQIMGFYDRAVGEMKAAGEVLTWAQQYLAEEKKVVLERLLKG